ncbi:WAT1-related protein At5g64700-like [Actinidia eriantha]|uniref:WAT1-related protein At5g64700-like n=1 Tax=Actinidia eriantha TaxID=165200 RepID=UPI00258C2028|nr:WAT1-related protein At5g64700-like [Actinidia eriantha]
MGAKEVVGMLMVQVFGTGLQLLSKVILSQGTFVLSLMAYRHVVGALCVAPFAFFWEKGKVKELNWSICFWLFMNALTGISMAMGLFYYGLRDTTATYATNFLNLIPIVTFIFSTIAGLEKLRLGTKAGKIKTAGAILCFAGALTIGLYKGKTFYIGHHSNQPHTIAKKVKHNWARGTTFLVCSILSYATWFLVQVKLFQLFPYKYWATMFTCIIASFQTAFLGICIDRNTSSWRLDWNLQLVTIVYSGVLATAASFVLISWAVAKRGPTYPSMFNPLALIFVTITEALFLGEPINVGSLIGMSLIITGLYSFLWGKSKESNGSPISKAIVGEASIVVAESVTMQGSAVVIPTASPSDNSYGNVDSRSQREVSGV